MSDRVNGYKNADVAAFAQLVKTAAAYATNHEARKLLASCEKKGFSYWYDQYQKQIAKATATMITNSLLKQRQRDAEYRRAMSKMTLAKPEDIVLPPHFVLALEVERLEEIMGVARGTVTAALRHFKGISPANTKAKNSFPAVREALELFIEDDARLPFKNGMLKASEKLPETVDDLIKNRSIEWLILALYVSENGERPVGHYEIDWLYQTPVKWKGLEIRAKAFPSMKYGLHTMAFENAKKYMAEVGCHVTIEADMPVFLAELDKMIEEDARYIDSQISNLRVEAKHCAPDYETVSSDAESRFKKKLDSLGIGDLKDVARTLNLGEFKTKTKLLEALLDLSKKKPKLLQKAIDELDADILDEDEPEEISKSEDELDEEFRDDVTAAISRSPDDDDDILDDEEESTEVKLSPKQQLRKSIIDEVQRSRAEALYDLHESYRTSSIGRSTVTEDDDALADSILLGEETDFYLPEEAFEAFQYVFKNTSKKGKKVLFDKGAEDIISLVDAYVDFALNASEFEIMGVDIHDGYMIKAIAKLGMKLGYENEREFFAMGTSKVIRLLCAVGTETVAGDAEVDALVDRLYGKGKLSPLQALIKRRQKDDKKKAKKAKRK